MLKQFKLQYPDVQVNICQHDHQKLNDMIKTLAIDFGFYSSIEPIKQTRMTAIPCYQWQPVLIFNQNHPLAQKAVLTLSDIVKYPLATYSYGVIVHELLSKVSKSLDVELNFILCTNNTTTIKEYVKEGVSIGIVNNIV